MKSKSFETASSSIIKKDHNNTFDFIRLYKTAEETKASLQKYKNNTDKDKTDDVNDVNTSTPKQERSVNKHKKNKTAVELSLINIEGPPKGPSGDGTSCNTSINDSKATSTPLAHREKVKSIMKTGTIARDDSMDGSLQEVCSVSKPKKRNKSVSFMLEDNDELAIKKTKSDDINQKPTLTKKVIKKKNSKSEQAEKENKVNTENKVAQYVKDKKEKRHKEKGNKKFLAMELVDGRTDTSSTPPETTPQEPIKKKRNKPKKIKKCDESEPVTKTQVNQNMEKKKAKKKKHEPKSQTDTEEEPASKSRKKEIKPELIAEDLENLSIGDNAHTLSSLLDEMTVTDSEKRKKLRKKASKSKKARSKDIPEAQTTEEGAKEKKWKRKRWNKERKAKETIEGLASAVVIDNLPISILFSYKKILAELFAKYGLLRNVGIAEVYPTEVSKPVFTTTVYFDNEDSATKALAENGSIVEGSRISVSRPLPATQTTAVVRTYGALTEQALSSAFTGAGAGAGRIRSIRIAIKGKKTMSTAFLEFDGPEAVERAIKMESEIKIGGKKIHVSRFELRTKRKEEKSGDNMASDADHSDDNETQT